MTKYFKSLALAGALTAASAVAASAATTIDFTDTGSYTFGTTKAEGSIMGVGWKLLPRGEGGNLTQNVPYDGDAAGKAGLQASSGLALEADGIGIDNDEASRFEEGREVLRMVFDQAVYITGLHFLDVFGDESVRVKADSLGGTLTVLSESAAGDNSLGGYAYSGDKAGEEGAWIKVLRFIPGFENDSDGGTGEPDFALAGVDVAAVPLPAGGVLLLTALGGLAIARRRKS